MSLPAVRLVEFNRIELCCLLRHIRYQRTAVHNDLQLLRERIAAGFDGANVAAAMALDADLMILDMVIKKLWQTELSF